MKQLFKIWILRSGLVRKSPKISVVSDLMAVLN